MLCPICKEVELRISERQGVEIDYCPQCRGVWLDRGELDKLIERANQEYSSPQFAAPAPPSAPPPAVPRAPEPRYEQPRYEQPRYEKPRYRDDDDDDYYKRRKRKGSGWLGELFDFD